MGRYPVKGGQREEEDMKAEGRERREGDVRVRLIVNKRLRSPFFLFIFFLFTFSFLTLYTRAVVMLG